MDLTLHSYWRSSASWRVRIVLGLKQLNYSTITVNLLKGEQMEEKYSKINPDKTLPALVVGGEIITQSTAIIEYLEEAFPESSVYPKDPIAKARVRAFCLLIACEIHPVQNLRVLKKINEETGYEKEKWASYWIARGLETVEGYLVKSSGKYCFGDTLTAADAYLIPQVYNAYRFKVDMSKFTTIVKVVSNLEVLEVFKKAHPSSQPDCTE